MRILRAQRECSSIYWGPQGLSGIERPYRTLRQEGHKHGQEVVAPRAKAGPEGTSSFPHDGKRVCVGKWRAVRVPWAQKKRIFSATVLRDREVTVHGSVSGQEVLAQRYILSAQGSVRNCNAQHLLSLRGHLWSDTRLQRIRVCKA